MEQRGDEIHTSTTEASGGSREGVVRWVLLIGLVLVIALLSIVWMTGALTQDTEDSQVNVSREIQETQATEGARGEPIAPAMEGPSASASAAPAAGATPGDAPAGDPQPNAQ